jgi:hypothetical protein
MNTKRPIFLRFCSEITGYTCFKLEGTSLVDTYQKLLEDVLGSKLEEFYNLIESVVSLEKPEQREEKISATLLPPSIYWPVVSGLISLWYLGYWSRLPDSWYLATGLPVPGPNDPGRTHVPSAAAYTEQLSYRTAGAHPPGAKPTGYGGWSIPPVFDESN